VTQPALSDQPTDESENRAVHEIDFLPVGTGEKSGDAIAFRFTINSRQFVAVIDGGYTEVGSNLANHIGKYYNTSRVDLVISTHPDADHINGLCTLLEELEVGELLLHLPANHGPYKQGLWGETVPELLAIAHRRRVAVTEPFAGLQRFDGAMTIVGPTKAYYRQLLAEHAEELRGKALTAAAVREAIQQFTKRALAALPFVETLGEDGVTSHCNNSSVISYWQLDGRRLLLTGDAGIPALRQAVDLLPAYGFGPATPLDFFQGPHHGSRRNLAPSLLNDLLGTSSAPFSSSTVAFISASKDAPKHPSPKVTNALMRRGCRVYTSEESAIQHGHQAPVRDDWGLARPVEPMDEGDE
jgi:beta-lactamase superfamily II metal-dependent hydrolase